MIIGIFLLSFFDPTATPVHMIALAFLVAIIAASQDSIIDAHRIEYLAAADYSVGASVSMTAYRVAMLITGALALILADYIGWQSTYQIMALLVIFGLMASIFSAEPINQIRAHSRSMSLKESIIELKERNEFYWLIGFIFFYKFAEAFTSITSPIMQPFLLNELHFSLTTIGFMNKGIGMLSTIIGGVVAGFLMMRWNIYKCLMIFGLTQAITNFPYIYLAYAGNNISVLSICVFGDNLANGMGITALTAYFMKTVNTNYSATQMSLLVSFSTIPLVLSGPIGALIVSSFGWLHLLVWSFAVAFLFIPFLLRLMKLNLLSTTNLKFN